MEQAIQPLQHGQLFGAYCLVCGSFGATAQTQTCWQPGLCWQEGRLCLQPLPRLQLLAGIVLGKLDPPSRYGDGLVLPPLCWVPVTQRTSCALLFSGVCPYVYEFLQE